MHTPDDPARAALRESLREMSKALIPLHRALINGARDDYSLAQESSTGPVTPTQLLGLINDDPFFAWLKPMTALIVDIDEMARRDFERPDVDDVVSRVERMIGVSPDEFFAERYVPLLQREVDVAIGHAAVRQALGKVPKNE
jgi:hypothetical protein